jgi:hypothetical protein
MKKLVMALALGILGASGAIGVGCSGSACDTYRDDLTAINDQCGVVSSSPAATSSSASCTDKDAAYASCMDACIPDINCTCLKTPSDSSCATATIPYNDCTANCGATP